MVTHPTTNRGRCRLTSLMQPTMLPLCQAANMKWCHEVMRMRRMAPQTCVSSSSCLTSSSRAFNSRRSIFVSFSSSDRRCLHWSDEHSTDDLTPTRTHVTARQSQIADFVPCEQHTMPWVLAGLYRWAKSGWNLSFCACHILLPLKVRFFHIWVQLIIICRI